MGLLNRDSAYRLASELLEKDISIENIAKKMLEVQGNTVDYFRDHCEFEMRVHLPVYPHFTKV